MSDGSRHDFSCETEWGDAEDLDCRGFCRDCGREHRLSAAPALPAAGLLMRELVRHGNIGLEQGRDPRLDLGCLDGPAGGIKELYFDLEEGGILCENCNRPGSLPISKDYSDRKSVV